MTVAWSFAGRRVEGFRDLLRQIGDAELRSPKRSTVPLLAHWRNAESSARELADALRFPLIQPLQLDFEHQTPVQRGRGKPSCTDLMLTSGATCIAVEAKSTEPRYEDVEAWLGCPPTRNRVRVLKGWLDLLGRAGGRRLEIGDTLRLPYQLIHRAASACHNESGRRCMAYQTFDATAKSNEHYVADLRALATVLGKGPLLELYLVEHDLEPTALQRELEERWAGGERDLSGPVRAGFEAGNLFHVRPRRVLRADADRPVSPA